MTMGRLEAALAVISDSLCIVDAENRIVWCNQRFEELVSASRMTLLNKSVVDLLQRLAAQDRRIDLRSALAKNTASGTLDLLVAQDPIKALRIEWSEISVEQPPSTIFTVRDISPQITLEELRTQQIELLSEETQFAVTSALCPITGLQMRHAMLSQVESLLSTSDGQLFALILFDIRAFRLINDRHGYPTGDEMLAEISRRLKQAIRSDEHLARMGSDQFAVFAHLDNSDELRPLTNRLRAAVESTPFLPTTTQAVIELNLLLDVGSAVVRAGQSTPASLLRAAELALESAQDGPSEAEQLVSEAGDSILQAELAVSGAVHHCLQHNLIPIALQPMVDLEAGATYGYEALARPLTAEGEPIPVHRFMALSEKLGLMRAVGELLIRSTFDTFRQARLAEQHMRLSLNLSPSQFAVAGLPDRLISIAKQFTIPPSLLTVEITETALVTDDDLLREEITKLRDHGVTVLLDDFGTGYSSLNWIFNVPTDGIKIDRSYTAAIDDPYRRLVMGSIASMCRDLGLDVVVEGIETEAQRIQLKDLGFTKGQGYLFGKPTPLSEFLHSTRIG